MADFLNNRIKIITGDITRLEVDAIVNAANSSLMGGGGVDGAIHKIGGPEILEQCRKIREKQYPKGLPAGDAVATYAGNLQAKYVIHTVGPIWYGGKSDEDRILASAYLNSLKTAEKLGCKTIAFPAISTGIYGFPLNRAAKIVSNTIRDYFNQNEKTSINKVYLVFFSQADYDIFLSSHELNR